MIIIPKVISVPDAVREDSHGNTITFRLVFNLETLDKIFPDISTTGPSNHHVESVASNSEEASKILGDRKMSGLSLVPGGNRPSHIPESSFLRNYHQIAWLHSVLCPLRPNIMAPVLPDPPIPNLTPQADYLEKKRSQIERYLNKLFYRRDIYELDCVKRFINNGGSIDPSLTTEMSSGRRTAASLMKSPLSFGILDHVIKSNYDRGFRIYRPAADIPENDQNSFLARQNYVLQLEAQYSTLLDNIVAHFRAKENLAGLSGQVSDAFAVYFSSKNLLGTGDYIDNAKRLVVFEDGISSFPVAFKNLSKILFQQARVENCTLGDTLLEYKGLLNSAKNLMNYRTDLLVEYINLVKTEEQKKIRAEKAQKSANNAAYTAITAADYTSTKQRKEDTKTAFLACQKSVSRELLRFEKFKMSDFYESINKYVSVQLEGERSRLQELEQALEKTNQLERSLQAIGDHAKVGGIGPPVQKNIEEMKEIKSRSTSPDPLGQAASIVPQGNVKASLNSGSTP